jgi:hypothetical protein
MNLVGCNFEASLFVPRNQAIDRLNQSNERTATIPGKMPTFNYGWICCTPARNTAPPPKVILSGHGFSVALSTGKSEAPVFVQYSLT